jgi:2-polyprenyl-3-methyl-5-hydroxy-6-metoxy-1,4-benzoquinol methylase
VAALLPKAPQRVLEVGCGTGQLGRLLVSAGHRVTGLELQPEAAEEARRYLDWVETGDVEAIGFPFAPASFDTILFADVLEHLVDPWRVLRQAVAVLAPAGRIIASIPNVQYIGVIAGLLRGRWRYRDRGILDRGHLRFFTLGTILDLFAGAGLQLTHIDYLYRRTRWRRLLAFLTAGRSHAFQARRYLVVAQRRVCSA